MRLDKIFAGSRFKVIRAIVFVFMAALIIIDFFMPRHHIYFPWDNIPGFYAVFGLVTCVLIIIFSKWLGKVWLQKKEDYYD